ncbi:MAG: hemolysin family protein [Caldilineales bacterium]|nr:hemolysin family protein [Caldilineales bacterium]MDW8318276.1 hemolysin family protein [Anaerolineae bacterium]
MLVVLIVVAALLLVNALYVGAEFATLSARRARLAQMADDGHPLARMILPIVQDPAKLDAYIAACQIGITVSSLILGFYAQATLSPVVAPWLSRLGGLAPAAAASFSATVVLLVLTGFQVILGELVPKNIGVQYPERLALLTAPAMRWSMALFRPLIWLFNGSGQLVLRLMGIQPVREHVHTHSPEEIALLVEESGAGGLLADQERRLIENTLWLGETTVRQLMVPRIRVLAAPVDMPCHELFVLLANSPFSRLPLYQGSLDNVVGVVHLKDLLCLQRCAGPDSGTASAPDVRQVMAAPLFVPETMRADEALALLQRRRLHVAVVLDEFGGTAGIVTLEDLIEEIFGEVQDEFDQELPKVRPLPGNRVMVRWDWLVEDLNDVLDLHLPGDEADTVGGLVLSRLGRAPQVGDTVQIGDLTLRVERVEGKAVSAVSFPATPDQVERLREALA